MRVARRGLHRFRRQAGIPLGTPCADATGGLERVPEAVKASPADRWPNCRRGAARGQPSCLQDGHRIVLRTFPWRAATTSPGGPRTAAPWSGSRRRYGLANARRLARSRGDAYSRGDRTHAPQAKAEWGRCGGTSRSRGCGLPIRVPAILGSSRVHRAARSRREHVVSHLQTASLCGAWAWKTRPAPHMSGRSNNLPIGAALSADSRVVIEWCSKRDLCRRARRARRFPAAACTGGDARRFNSPPARTYSCECARPDGTRAIHRDYPGERVLRWLSVV